MSLEREKTFFLQGGSARTQLGFIQKFVDHGCQIFRAFDDFRGGFLLLFVQFPECIPLKKLRIAKNASQRSPQFVADLREQAGLGEVGFQCLVPRDAQGIICLFDGGNIACRGLESPRSDPPS